MSRSTPSRAVAASVPRSPARRRTWRRGLIRGTLFLLACATLLLFRPGCGAAGAAPAEPAALPRLWVDRPLLRIELEGLRRTRPEVVLRELSARTDRPVEWQGLDRDRLRLLDTELFASVDLRARRDRASDRPVLTVTVRERPSVLALPTGEYSEEDGITLGAAAQDLNFRGRAEHAGVAGAWGGRRYGTAWWSTRWVFERRLPLGLSASRSRRTNEAEGTIEDRASGGLALAPTRGPSLSFPCGAGAEAVKTRRDPQAGLGLVSAERDDHRWLSAGVRWDNRGYRARAERGLVLGAGVAAHGGLLGGTTSLEQYLLDAAVVRPTGRGSALTFASRLVLSRGGVPSYLRMGLGGSSTLRGSAPNRWRGENRWVGWVEERIPLLGRRTLTLGGGRWTLDLTVDGALFADAGAIWEDGEDRTARPRLHGGGGAGLRLVVPFVSVLNLDVATDGESFRLHTSTGVRL